MVIPYHYKFSFMTGTEDAWYDEQDPSKAQSLPRAMCFADKGCSVGVSTKQQLFLSDPPMPIRNGDIPVFSVHQLANKSWVGTIGTLTADGSAASGESGSLVMDKNRVDPGQPINFSIVSGNWGNTPGTNMFVTGSAKMTATTNGSFTYTINSTSSANVSAIHITPFIWQATTFGDILVFTDRQVTCLNSRICSATGSYVADDSSATYFTNATVQYTLPGEGTRVAGVPMTSLRIVPGSGLAYDDSTYCNIPTDPYFGFTVNKVYYPCERGTTTYRRAVCGDNALLRWALAGDTTSFSSTISPWMWKRDDSCTGGHSFDFGAPYKKSIYYTGVKNTDIGWYHAVAAEYTGSGTPSSQTALSDWRFFNYENDNISLGDIQIPSGNDVCNTDIWIRPVTSLSCSAVTTPILKLYYIDKNNVAQTSQLASCAEHPPTVTKEVGTQFSSLKDTLEYVRYSANLPTSRWELSSSNNEITFFVYNVNNETIIAEYQGKRIGNYTIQFVHDTEFEKNRDDVLDYLFQLQADPAYQIARIDMMPDPFGEFTGAPENYAELWVYNLTPKNRELVNSSMNGWNIEVYPVSKMPDNSN